MDDEPPHPEAQPRSLGNAPGIAAVRRTGSVSSGDQGTSLDVMNSHLLRRGAMVVCALLAVLPATAQDAPATIKAAEYALGMIRGPQRIDAISTLEYWGTGYTYSFGQAFRPDMPWPAFKVTYHASLSYAVPAMRVDVVRSNPDGPGPVQ